MSVESVLLSHFARYPAMGLADLYKLIHQAALGSEHAIRNPEAARRWLNEELASLARTGRTSPRPSLGRDRHPARPSATIPGLWRRPRTLASSFPSHSK
ncbi:MAG: hypothetical protein RMJ60_02985 [Anaerolineales bacterium]|nr:hypothetical protein [Anaerolineales bacterium]